VLAQSVVLGEVWISLGTVGAKIRLLASSYWSDDIGLIILDDIIGDLLSTLGLFYESIN
jgi:hypothetical protein